MYIYSYIYIIIKNASWHGAPHQDVIVGKHAAGHELLQ